MMFHQKFKESKIKPTEFWQASGDSLPILVGVVPFGITFGVVARAVGLTGAETMLMSAVVFAGAAQFVCITMIGMGAVDATWIILTTFLINMRHLLMGASISSYVAELPLVRQAVLAFGMTDESYAVSMERIHKLGYSESYHLGANFSMYGTWLLATFIGVVAGNYIPDPLEWGLDFAMPVTFLAILIPKMRSKTTMLVSLAAALTAAFCAANLPGKWYIVITCIIASILGGVLEGDNQDAD